MAQQPLVEAELRQHDSQLAPVALTWKSISYSVVQKKFRQPAVQKDILKGITGHAAPGTFTSILGASGSGKTSLLSVLADRLLATRGAKLSGSVQVNGHPRTPAYRRACAFVQQVELFYPHSTVRETVEMAARLRLGGSLSRTAKQQRALEVIRLLGLSKALDTYVGDGKNIKGISGGEMKRVSIACELVSRPSILMLDEPTSGLDSTAALKVLEILVDLGRSSGCTVVASIHQPGSPLYALFQNMILLAEGRVAFFGPASIAVDHFAALGLKCPALYNPADYLLQITSIDHSSAEVEAETTSAVDQLLDNYRSSCDTPVVSGCGDAQLAAVQGNTCFCEQFGLLYARVLQNILRNKAAIGIKVFENVLVTSVMVMLYSDLDKSNAPDIVAFNMKALLFFNSTTNFYGALMKSVQTFSLEVGIVLRERMNNLYPVAPYYIAKMMGAVPADVVIPGFVFSSIAFWILKLTHDTERYLVFVSALLLCSFASMSLGFALSALTGGNVDAAQAAMAPIVLVFLLLGGLYVNLSTVPTWIRWMSKINYAEWTWEVLCVNNFRSHTIAASGGVLSGDAVIANDFNNGHSKTDEEWQNFIWTRLLALVICCVLLNLLGFVVLLNKGPKYLAMSPLPAGDEV